MRQNRSSEGRSLCLGQENSLQYSRYFRASCRDHCRPADVGSTDPHIRRVTFIGARASRAVLDQLIRGIRTGVFLKHGLYTVGATVIGFMPRPRRLRHRRLGVAIQGVQPIDLSLHRGVPDSAESGVGADHHRLVRLRHLVESDDVAFDLFLPGRGEYDRGPHSGCAPSRSC